MFNVYYAVSVEKSLKPFSGVCRTKIVLRIFLRIMKINKKLKQFFHSTQLLILENNCFLVKHLSKLGLRSNGSKKIGTFLHNFPTVHAWSFFGMQKLNINNKFACQFSQKKKKKLLDKCEIPSLHT